MTTSRRLLHTIIVVLVLGLPCVLSERASAENSPEALQYYFELVASENFESAALMWSAAAQERSSRFGITYAGIPVRPDATSPIIRDLATMRYHLTPAAKQVANLDKVGAFMRLEFSNVVGEKLVTWPYFMEQSNGYYMFIYPQDFYCKDWQVIESKYFRIHAHSDLHRFLNPAALAEADQFVDRLSDSLKIDKLGRQALATSKIEYFYCPSDSVVKQITGQQTKGLLDLASNDIITADFPHFHEITHLLINVALKDVPIETLPLIREGISVRFGGRWGKRASALMDLGVYLYKEKLVELDSMLTVKSFQVSAGADIAYPVAGLFASYLYEKMGSVKFWAFYRAASHTDMTLDTLGQLPIRRMLVEAAGVADWNALLSEFDTYLDRTSETVAVARPGKGAKAKEIYHNGNCLVTRDKEWVCFEFQMDSADPKGVMLFGLDKRLQGRSSHLFQEHFGDTYFEGFRYSVRFDRNEAGLYDYATNELIAKYIWGLKPQDDYFDEASKTIRIRFRANLIKEWFTKDQECRLVLM